MLDLKFNTKKLDVDRIVYNWLDETKAAAAPVTTTTTSTSIEQKKKHVERRINKRLIIYKNTRCDIFYCFHLLFSCVNYPWFWSEQKRWWDKKPSINSTRKTDEQQTNTQTTDDVEKKKASDDHQHDEEEKKNLSNITCCVWERL